jgi:isoquinoline 1-oxidoreductase beta subunit
VKGVVAVKQIPSGYAIYADGTWPAIKGRLALGTTWDDHAAENRGSEEMIAEALDLTKARGVTVGSAGDADKALAGTAEIIDATYVLPFLAHAPMEPLDGYLRWDQAGAHARYGCQFQSGDQIAIAKVLGFSPDKIAIETMLAGGSFGRRVDAGSNFAKELAEVAKAIGPGQAVKLIWTREDDIQGGYYRPLAIHRFRGAVSNGRIVAWANSIASQPIVGAPLSGISEGADKLLYDIANFRCDVHPLSGAVPTNSWRSVGHSHTGYAVECFVDLLLEKAGKDPVAGRLELMSAAPRAAGVLKAVARLAGWNGAGPVDGRARGVAVVKAFGSFVAQIAEVSADPADNPRVHKVWCAIDCGIAVNPDIIRAQMESGIGYGAGHILYAEIPIKAGASTVSNFNDYRALTIDQMPDVEVVVVSSSEHPTGVGELGVPPIGPAIANALARLIGARPSRLPMVRAS